MTTWQRARNPDQKAQRKEEILAAAKRLFAAKSYEEVSLNGIAREAGMSKPNVYRYFTSREEIFLLIFAEENERFNHTLWERLETLDDAATEEMLARCWVLSALESDGLMTLLPQLGASLEQNSSLEQLVLFKKVGFQQMAHTAQLHHRLMPRLTVETWSEVISGAVAILAGFGPLCSNTDVVRQAMAHPDVNLEPWDFEKKATFALTALFRGASN